MELQARELGEVKKSLERLCDIVENSMELQAGELGEVKKSLERLCDIVENSMRRQARELAAIHRILSGEPEPEVPGKNLPGPWTSWSR